MEPMLLCVLQFQYWFGRYAFLGFNRDCPTVSLPLASNVFLAGQESFRSDYLLLVMAYAFFFSVDYSLVIGSSEEAEGQTPRQKKTLGNLNGGLAKGGSIKKMFFYLQLEFFCLQLSFFASSPLRPLLDALSHCKQKTKTVSKKAKIVSKKAPTVSEKAKFVNCKYKHSTVSRKLPTVSKKVASLAKGESEMRESGPKALCGAQLLCFCKARVGRKRAEYGFGEYGFKHQTQ